VRLIHILRASPCLTIVSEFVGPSWSSSRRPRLSLDGPDHETREEEETFFGKNQLALDDDMSCLIDREASTVVNPSELGRIVGIAVRRDIEEARIETGERVA
jgi:hypothetical protein